MNAISGIQSYRSIYSSASAIEQLLSSGSISTGGFGSMSGTSALNALANIAISSHATQINSIYNKLKGINDPVERQSALDGMRSILIDLVKDPSKSKLMSFVSNAGNVMNTNLSDFQQIFSGGANITENPTGYAGMREGSTDNTRQNFVDKYGAVSASSLSKSFAGAGIGIITSSATSSEKAAAYNALLDKAYEIVSSDLSEEQIDGITGQFFSDLAEQITVRDQTEFIKNFDVQGILDELGLAEGGETAEE